MANGAIGYINRVMTATLVASSQQASLPATNLQSPHMAIKWRSATHTGVTLDVDAGSSVPWRAIGLFASNFTPTATWTIALGATQGSSGVYSSGSINQNQVAGYGQAIHVLSAPLSARWLRLTLGDAALSGLGYFEIGGIFAGPLFQPARNFQYGRTAGWIDPSIKSRSKGGQIFADIKPKFRVQDFQFAYLSEQEAFDAEDIDQAAGTVNNVLFIPDPAGAFLTRDCIFGTIEDASGRTHSAHPIFGKRYRIQERL